MRSPMELEKFLNKPMFIFDLETQFSDLLDFIEFSEYNIEWQKRSQLQRLRREANLLKFDSDEYFSKLQSIQYRFDINLTRKVRYGSLIALVISIQWIIDSIKNKLTWHIKKKPKNVNISVHIITEILDKYCEPVAHNMQIIESIIKIRNCIVHSGGIVKGYKYQNEIEDIVSNIEGCSIPADSIPGDIIDLDEKCIEKITIETKTWIVPFIEGCIIKGLIKL